MSGRKARQYKALYFDLFINELKHNYPKRNYLNAYRDIKNYLLQHDFKHEQWSGYHSEKKMTDLDIFDLVQDISSKFTWLHKCINHFAVTNVGVNYNLIDILQPAELDEDIKF